MTKKKPEQNNKLDTLTNKQIDILVAEKIKGWKRCTQRGEDYDTEYYFTKDHVRLYEWSPTFFLKNTLDSAKGHRIRLSNKSSDTYWWAYVDDAIAQDRNPLRAICKALLMTLEKKKKC